MPDTTPGSSQPGSLRWLIGISTIVILAMVIGFVIQGYQSHWTGFGVVNYLVRENQQYTPAKTLWDWLGLLIVPIAIAVSVAAIGLLDRRNERRIADERIKQDRQAADERAQDTAVEAYLDQISKLLLEKNLLVKGINSNERKIARTLTLTVLQRLSGERKGVVLQFLQESGLIIGDNPVISLMDANLKGVSLEMVNLHKANLRSANLTGAFMPVCLLEGAYLEGAIFDNALLFGTDFSSAELATTSFSGAELSAAGFNDANLVEADFSDAYMVMSYFRNAKLQRATFYSALVYGIDFENTNLSDAQFDEAVFVRCDLRSATLDKTSFSDVRYAHTYWPANYDPSKANAIAVDDMPQAERQAVRSLELKNLPEFYDPIKTAEIFYRWIEKKSFKEEVLHNVTFEAVRNELLRHTRQDKRRLRQQRLRQRK